MIEEIRIIKSKKPIPIVLNVGSTKPKSSSKSRNDERKNENFERDQEPQKRGETARKELPESQVSFKRFQA